MEVPTAFGPLKFITDDEEPDAMILHEIITLNRYQVPWPHLGIESSEVLDIGAHKGFFSVMAAAAGARVTCYEPNPKSFRILLRNVALNGLAERVSARNLGVWSESGVRNFVGPKNNSGCSTTVDPDKPIYAQYDRFSAECISVNEAFAGKSWLFMKMDAEGAEVEIVEAASEAELHLIQRFGIELHGRYFSTNLPDKLRPIFDVSWIMENRKMCYIYGDRRPETIQIYHRGGGIE